jgi:thiamine-phosphate pyrophosphorylase
VDHVSENTATDIRCRLYLITPPQIGNVGAFAGTLEDALQGGDVACLQIRLKDVSDQEIIDAGAVLTPIAQNHGVAVLINDRPDLAQQIGADGAHIGQDDAPYREARKLLGPDAIIGVTAHNSRHLAMVAGESGADYVAFGAFFDTATKDPKSRAETEILNWWSDLFVAPCVAIGGITTGNCAPLIEAGADFLAVSSGVWAHPSGPNAAITEFNEIMTRMI